MENASLHLCRRFFPLVSQNLEFPCACTEPIKYLIHRCVFQSCWLWGAVQLQHLSHLQRWKTRNQFENAPVGAFWLFVNESRRNTENQGNICEGKILEIFFILRLQSPEQGLLASNSAKACQSSKNIWTMLLIIRLGSPVRCRELDLIIFMGPFQLKILYDFVKRQIEKTGTHNMCWIDLVLI